LSVTESNTHQIWNLDFFDIEKENIVKNLLWMIRIAIDILKSTYSGFHERLSLLPNMPNSLTHLMARYDRLRRTRAPGSPVAHL
jgi:hypothetical protein